MRTHTAVALAILSVPMTASADAMRCGKWVLNEDSTPTAVLEKCGEPQDKEISREDVLGKNAAGNPVKLGVQVTERWRYQRTPGSLPMLVTIVDGKVKRIERAE
jgi:hypothetical protein